MLSITCKTGLRAVLFLASRVETKEKFSIPELAAVVEGNEHTLGKLLQTLVKNKVISSTKGPGGGFFIAPEQIQAPIWKIVLTLDGDDFFQACALGLSQCSATRPCPLHNSYASVREELAAIFRSTTIQDLSKDLRTGAAFLS
ncbi:Rrf2 family transcriptional regulator [Flavihumibacter sp. CACIAM 22H1]|uniref:RrF2 family transcriptional regulator n=1 Tax=Flavihumibacter sp. CACIAM 22H1 TaxID=1812911 RepID=UPI0007A89340|nr:Rrf2 family transcriptional regulator [Flavihumibacter sp. CACIAM 22H1]KYP13506.1 MAG: hypothetical protein A1D16_14530 [Flavihumibacter sp. CACIAM 22H1]